MRPQIPKGFLRYEKLSVEVKEFLDELRESDQSSNTHLNNAYMQNYVAYWVAVLIFCAERSVDTEEYLIDFIKKNTDQKGRIEHPAQFALEILKVSR